MLQIGMIVKILPDAEYSGKFTGYIGKVKNYFSQNKKVGVELFQQTNDASSKGLFWFSESKVVAAGTLPDAMMECIKADLSATFGVANHTRRSRQTGLPQIKKVIYSGPKTIILWADNTKTIVSCGEADSYDYYSGFCAAVVKKLFGSTTHAKRFWVIPFRSMINLFQHQQQALDETEGKNRVAYYLDMGLGKTFVGSEKMMKLNKRINLVVCQCSKVQDWIEHFQDHYTRNCVFDLTNPKTFKWFFEQVQHEVPTLMIGVINYELTFRRNVLKTLTGFTLMLDESSLIQNENAKRSKFILGLKPDNVILLSGTPTGGKYENLWSQCQLLGWKISKELFWKQYIQTEWVETDGFWRQQITGYKNVDRLKMKLAEHGAVFMTTEQAGISLPKRNWIKVKTRPSPLYWKFWNDRYVAIDSANLGEFELDADFYGSNAHCERELIGDTSLTRRLYARQLCGLYNPARYEAFRDLANSTEDRLIVFYNFTEEMERLKGIAKGLNRPVSVLSGEEKNLDAYRYQHNSITFIQYQAGAMGGNFQLANKIIYFSVPQGSELWEQSQKRIHRLGQERPCFYYLMICPGTVEEDILSTLEMRKDYTDELFRKYEQAATAPQSP